jgi:hypothetical protein
MPNRADTFNRTDESPLATPSDAGSDWVSINGTIAVVTNEARGTSNESRSYLECGTADGDVVAEIGSVNLGSGHVLGRVTDANNSLFALLSATTLTIWKQVASSYTQVLNVTGLTIAEGDTFGLRMAGDQVTLLHNGSTVGAAQTISDFTSVTKHGIRFDNPATLNAFAFTAAVGGTAPDAPTIGTATSAGTDAIDLTWTDNSDDEDDFRVQYDTVNTFDDDPQELVIETEDTESTEIGSLLPNTTYYFRVRAENAFGNSDWSDTVSATTDAEVSPEEETRISSPAGWLRRRRLKF